ncbi:MAG: preprotein translocase subunit YajC [Gammaproteobacteria bacterium]
MSMWSLLGIQDALADAPAPAPASPAHGAQSLMSLVWMLAAFMIIFYFLLLRPQTKRAKEQRKLLESLTKGDEVITNGGLAGRIVKVTDNFIVLNIADNVDITVQKMAVVTVLPKGTLKAI